MPNIIFKLGIHIPTDEKVAIKILEKDKIQDKEDLERISREINFLSLYFHFDNFLNNIKFFLTNFFWSISSFK